MARRPGLRALLLGFFVSFAAAAPAHAIATYSAGANATITLLGFQDATGAPIAAPAGLTIDGFAEVFNLDSFQSGTGVANVGGVVSGTTPNMAPGDSVHLQSAVGGSALLPDGTAFSGHDTDGTIGLDNQSGQAVTVLFHVAYGWNLSISVNDLNTEQAFADLYIDILGGVADLCGCIPNPAVDVLVDQFADSADLLAPGAAGGSDAQAFDFSIALAAGDFAFIDMFLGASGLADAFFIPAPGGLAAVLPAALLVLIRRRRCRA